ncbi:hypothetical protein CEXT_196281 [Caerostris extrusa]|uniref:Uncharacterized protein n=1 Tax=Caerostris extrusa TaxID=172846 RepID=A0AAV4VKH6_CAEEX|nr:hypothetical protein CEXT_196281 [Caerostris extrusa]
MSFSLSPIEVLLPRQRPYFHGSAAQKSCRVHLRFTSRVKGPFNEAVLRRGGTGMGWTDIFRTKISRKVAIFAFLITSSFASLASKHLFASRLGFDARLEMAYD